MLSEEDAREVAKWAGRKLSDYWLRELSKAHDKGKDTFDTLTEQLFASKCCADDYRLRGLLIGTDEERLMQFRDALWRHVAPAITDYTNQPPSKRVAMYLEDLARDTAFTDEESIVEMESELEEVVA